MPVFEYEGLDARGRNIRGIVDAEGPRAARTKLKAGDGSDSRLLEMCGGNLDNITAATVGEAAEEVLGLLTNGANDVVGNAGNLLKNPGFEEDFVNTNGEGHVLSFKGDKPLTARGPVVAGFLTYGAAANCNP